MAKMDVRSTSPGLLERYCRYVCLFSSLLFLLEGRVGRVSRGVGVSRSFLPCFVIAAIRLAPKTYASLLTHCCLTARAVRCPFARCYLGIIPSHGLFRLIRRSSCTFLLFE